MDFNRVSRGLRIAGIAGVLLFIDLWMSWYSVDLKAITGASSSLIASSGIDTSATAWQAFSWTDLLLALTALVAIAAAAGAAARSDLPFKLAPVIGPLASFMTLLVLYRILNQPGPNKLINVEWGAYVGLILVATVAYGGFHASRETSDFVAPAAPAPAA